MYHTLYTRGNGTTAENHRIEGNRPMTDKDCWDRNSHGASRTIFKLVSAFKEADRNYISVFLFEMASIL
jgi:hypothetical protein